MKTSVEQTIEKMKRRIIDHFQPERIVLFGSYARNDYNPDSDVDFLIVLPISHSKRKITVEAYRSLAGMGLPKDIVIVTPEEYEKYKEMPGTLIRSAVREGKVLYERPH